MLCAVRAGRAVDPELRSGLKRIRECPGICRAYPTIFHDSSKVFPELSFSAQSGALKSAVQPRKFPCLRGFLHLCGPCDTCGCDVNEFGCPSIKTKVLSIRRCALRCFSQRVVAREGGGPRLWKSQGQSFPGETDRFTNHRSGRNLGHDSSMRIPICIGTRAPNQCSGLSASQRTTRATRLTV